MSSTLYLNAKEQLRVESSWYQKPGGMSIHLTSSGDYVYGNGKPVIDKSHFTWFPTVERERALAWYVKKFGEVKKVADSGETFSEPIAIPTEPDLDAEAAEVPDEV